VAQRLKQNLALILQRPHHKTSIREMHA